MPRLNGVAGTYAASAGLRIDAFTGALRHELGAAAEG